MIEVDGLGALPQQGIDGLGIDDGIHNIIPIQVGKEIDLGKLVEQEKAETALVEILRPKIRIAHINIDRVAVVLNGLQLFERRRLNIGIVAELQAFAVGDLVVGVQPGQEVPEILFDRRFDRRQLSAQPRFLDR